MKCEYNMTLKNKNDFKKKNKNITQLNVMCKGIFYNLTECNVNVNITSLNVMWIEI